MKKTYLHLYAATLGVWTVRSHTEISFYSLSMSEVFQFV